MTVKDFRIYYGMVNYTIGIDKDNKVSLVQFGNDLPYYRTACFSKRILKDTTGINIFKTAIKFFLVAKPEEFMNFYEMLYQNDSEMFEYAKEVVEEIGSICLHLSTFY